MELKPRDELLRTWQAVVRSSFQDGRWTWGGREGTDSLSDAAQLASLLSQATEPPGARLDTGREFASEILHGISAYLRAYTDHDGRPVFSTTSGISVGADA